MPKQKVDIAIVGAGIVGCMLAKLVNEQLPHKKIALIDQQAPAPFKVSDEVGLRVYAINQASQTLFEETGLWSKIQSLRCSPYQSMHVWENDVKQGLSFHAADIKQDHLGHIIEHNVLHDVLFTSIQGLKGIGLYCPASVQNISMTSDKVWLDLDGADDIEANLLVAADGAHSTIRSMSNISADKNSYLQSALVATVDTQHSHQHTAWQRFLTSGPLAFLPLQNGQSSIVWSLPHAQAKQLANCESIDFIEALSKQSQSHLGDILGTSQRVLFPLQQLQASHYVKPRLALVGDAAHVVHPLAGQGLNLGLNDVSILAKVLSQADTARVDLGHLYILKRYARQSQVHNRLMSDMFGGLNSLFASRHPLLSQVRASGLSLVDKNNLLKRFFIQQAIGRI